MQPGCPTWWWKSTRRESNLGGSQGIRAPLTWCFPNACGLSLAVCSSHCVIVICLWVSLPHWLVNSWRTGPTFYFSLCFQFPAYCLTHSRHSPNEGMSEWMNKCMNYGCSVMPHSQPCLSRVRREVQTVRCRPASPQENKPNRMELCFYCLDPVEDVSAGSRPCTCVYPVLRVLLINVLKKLLIKIGHSSRNKLCFY